MASCIDLEGDNIVVEASASEILEVLRREDIMFVEAKRAS